jgi:hypothetical protein
VKKVAPFIRRGSRSPPSPSSTLRCVLTAAPVHSLFWHDVPPRWVIVRVCLGALNLFAFLKEKKSHTQTHTQHERQRL